MTKAAGLVNSVVAGDHLTNAPIILTILEKSEFPIFTDSMKYARFNWTDKLPNLPPNQRG